MTAAHGDTITCPCCGSVERSRLLDAQERQLAVTTPYHQGYACCETCGSWYAIPGTLPFDPAAHYPGEYYSLAPIRDSWLTAALRGARARHVVFATSPLGWALARKLGIPDDLAAVARVVSSPATTICDVGAGNGRLLHDLHAAGFTRLVGCDPFGPQQDGPPRLVRGDLTTVDGVWELIMYHHCLEHIDEPRRELQQAMTRLAPGGAILVRVPLADSEAAQTYGPRWVQLDAPRHRVIPTVAGMRAMARALGLVVADAWRDSTAFQFWGSELYRRDVPLRTIADPREEFSAIELRDWAARAQHLNAVGRGDQGVFVLRRPD